MLCQISLGPELRGECCRHIFSWAAATHCPSLHHHVDHVGGMGGHVQQLMQVPAAVKKMYDASLVTDEQEGFAGNWMDTLW